MKNISKQIVGFVLSLLMPVMALANLNIDTVELKREPVIDMDSPTLKIEDYFKGRTWAWGVFEDRSGNVTRCYKVEMDGKVENNVLELDERFTYEDGTESTRLWKIKILPDNQYEGTAGDVIGLAKGQSAGNTFFWKYKLELPVSGRTWRLNFDDRLYLQDDGILLNIAKVTKWGFNVGRLTFAFSKEGNLLDKACNPSKDQDAAANS
ncbi:DUF3833 domain-containing protein [Parendozoicomonas haliclonae]|uniref:DUF3833 domain-containing protein n=1 Tax=Parendozoicomonas haliclonae TaxID=1960125 RepID=A0A1X7AH57_9GAMM|nr:DUF3833 domain-containing protein [Parendozoicomonas haliclonae]SMA40253.1 hypothetical protein EHSB41UT_01162 [Parendozoicomonas haliclonae]